MKAAQRHPKKRSTFSGSSSERLSHHSPGHPSMYRRRKSFWWMNECNSVRMCYGKYYSISCWIKCVCACPTPRQKIEDLEAERQRLEEQNNILEMRLERHNLQVSSKASLRIFSVMDSLVPLKETNLINLGAAAWSLWHLQIDSHRSLLSDRFQAQLDPGVIPAESNGKVVEAVAEVKSSFIGGRD